jgi:hypothetical protein
MDKILDAVSTATSATVGTTTSFLSGAAETATNAVTSSIQLFNVKEIFSSMSRQYILMTLLKEPPTPSTSERIVTNISLTLSQLSISPFERCRILLKNQHLLGKTYTGVFDSFFSELRTNGLRSTFRGALPLTFYHLFYFNLLDYRVKTLFKALQDIEKKNHLVTVGNLLLYDLGLLAVSQPIDCMAHRIACTNRSDTNVNLKMMLMYAQRSLYQGFTANFGMLAMNYSILIPSLYLLNSQGMDQLQQFLTLLGIVAVAEAVSYPFDLIKGRLMVQGFNSIQVKYDSLVDCVRKIYREEHLCGFYKGGLTKAVNFGLRKGIFIGLCGYVGNMANIFNKE